MKLLIFSFIFASWNAYSQQDISDTLTNNSPTLSDWHSENAINGSVTISKRTGEDQVIHNREFFENEIIRINSQIESINSKIETVNADPELKLKAEEESWFDSMEHIKEELNIQKLEIQNTLNNN